MYKVFFCVFVLYCLTVSAARVSGGRSHGPTTHNHTTETFSLPLTRKGNHTKHYHSALRKAYFRYGAKLTLPFIPASTTSKIQARTDGTVVAAPVYGDSEYICVVKVGNQKMRLDVDTGSADLWVFSTYLPRYQGHRFYDPTNSSAFSLVVGSGWYITYADGTYAGGIVGTDTVSMGKTVVTNQAVELAETVSDGYINDPNTDGLLGLSFSTINTVRPKQVSTFFENAIPVLKKSVFTASLKHNAPGSYDFGYIDSTKYTGTLRYAMIHPDNGFWQVMSSAYQINGKQYNEPVGNTAILDTGTSLLMMSDKAVRTYWNQVPGAGYSADQLAYIFPCNSTLPDLILKIGGGSGASMATVPGQFMNYGATNSDGSICYGALQSRGSAGMNIYGDVFFKANFVVFDKGKMRVGVAPHL